jgi:hypothetical protein
MMMAVFSPKTHGIAFEEPQVIRADLVENGNVTAVDQDVTIFSNTMMKWRGECFITTGNGLCYIIFCYQWWKKTVVLIKSPTF